MKDIKANITADIKEIANTLSHLTNLPAFYICDGNLELLNGQYLTRYPLNLIQNILFTHQIGQIGNARLTKAPQLIRYVNAYNLSFLVIITQVRPLATLVLGPFFLEDKDSDALIHALCNLEGSPFTETEAIGLIDAIEIKDSLFVQAWGKTVLTFLGKSYGTYIRINTIKQSNTLKENLAIVAENRMEEAEIISHYQFEHEIQQLVMQGDREQLRKKLLPKDTQQLALAHLNPIYTSRNKGPNPLRVEKNLILTLNVIMRQAADDASLPAIYIHSVSEEITAKIESAASSEELLNVIQFMIDSYCNAINNISLQNHSVHVVRVQRYIVNNIDKKISLADLADLTGLEVSYLCRLFKRECHMTINDYIQKQRINEAKWMLESSSNSIIDISHLLGFSSQSYFCSVFKKLVGVSPAKYRLNHGHYYTSR